MHSTITFSFTADDHPAHGINADAFPIDLTAASVGINSYQRYQQLRILNDQINFRVRNSVRDQSVVRLGRNFRNLRDYGTTPLSQYNGQDKFETLVHELSHVILGTEDVPLQNGATAYQADNARALARQTRGKVDRRSAYNNAENWGFFVEEFLD